MENILSYKKECIKCKEIKDSNEFYENKIKNYFYKTCKPCMLSEQSKYRKSKTVKRIAIREMIK